MDTVWRQAVRDEAASGRGETTLSALWDLRQFYERISHVRLASKARRLHFPVQLTRVCIAAYRMARNVSMRGWVSSDLRPRRGVVAGCFAATTWVKVFYLEELDEVCGLHSWTSSWTTSPPVVWARRRRWSATRRMASPPRASFEDQLECAFAP